jgi:hypothetical protein
VLPLLLAACGGYTAPCTASAAAPVVSTVGAGAELQEASGGGATALWFRTRTASTSSRSGAASLPTALEIAELGADGTPGARRSFDAPPALIAAAKGAGGSPSAVWTGAGVLFHWIARSGFVRVDGTASVSWALQAEFDGLDGQKLPLDLGPGARCWNCALTLSAVAAGGGVVGLLTRLSSAAPGARAHASVSRLFWSDRGALLASEPLPWLEKELAGATGGLIGTPRLRVRGGWVELESQAGLRWGGADLEIAGGPIRVAPTSAWSISADGRAIELFTLDPGAGLSSAASAIMMSRLDASGGILEPEERISTGVGIQGAAAVAGGFAVAVTTTGGQEPGIDQVLAYARPGGRKVGGDVELGVTGYLTDARLARLDDTSLSALWVGSSSVVAQEIRCAP